MDGNEELAGLSTEGLEREIAELGGHINAATARWLGLVCELGGALLMLSERRHAWRLWRAA